MPISRQTVLAALCALSAVSCEDALAPVTGAVRVAASTTGVDFDPDGYRISIGTDSVGWVQANESVIINGFRPGPRAVRLSGFAGNCALAPAPTPPLSVTVVASDTVDATFDVQCSSNVGTLYVAPLSSGEDVDGDYLVSLDGGDPMELDTQGIWLHGTPAGTHSLTLSGLASNCLAQPATITTVVEFNRTTTASHLVQCSARLGGLRVQTATTGVESDVDGYDVEIESVSSSHLAPNGTATVGGIREGNRTVTLKGVSANCTVSGGNARSVMIAFGVTTDLTFDVTCVAAAKVRVTLNTTGIDADQGYRVRLQGPELDSRNDAPGNGAITISGMGAGSHTVTLEDVAINCDLAAGSVNPQTITATAGNTTDVVFDVACAVAPQVAFVSWFNGQRVASAKANGTAVTILTSAITDQHDPEYSPDGTRIAFRAASNGNTDIYIMNADGSGLTRITTHAAYDMNPAWSPDGSKIAFTTDRDGNHEIYVMNADGSNVTRLTNNSAFDFKPTWSPDGGKIAFTSERDGSGQIYVMNADGSNVVRLTNTSEWADLPAWSPDGSKIAFVRWVECDDYYSSCHNIFVMNANGTGEMRFETRSHDSEPAWSPDGRWIVFETRYCDYYYCEAQSISVIKADGTGRTTMLNGDHYNPTWRP